MCIGKISACFGTRIFFLKKVKISIDKRDMVWYSIEAVCCGKRCGGEYEKRI
jgi:hypothetical protein